VDTKHRVAFLGLGAMGDPMSRNLVRAGFPTVVWNRTAAKTAPLAEAGAQVAATPSEAAAQADVVVLCVPTQVEVHDLLVRADGILASARPGTAIVDCSTIDPNAAIAHHALCRSRGIDYLEAPVSGGTTGAQAGTLTLMTGGDEAVLERVRPVLLAMGKNIFHMGAPGTGQVTKLCNNLIMAAQMVAVAEAYTLLAAAQIDPAKATDVFKVSTANCTAIQMRCPVPGVQPHAPSSNGWQPGFATEWMAKDLDLALGYARSAGAPVLQVALDHQVHRMAIQEGYGKLDLSTIGKMLLDRLAAERERDRR
jgi:3-hydroxyisobutyrate dehydrogenase